MPFRQILFLALGLLVMACSGPRKSASYKHQERTPIVRGSLVQFEKSGSFVPVMEKAAQLDKPIFMEFYTTWCAPCKLMDKDVFSHSETANFLNTNFVNYKVNAEKENGPDLAMIYGVRSFPTLLFLDENGKILLRHEGVAYQKTLMQFGKSVLEHQRQITTDR